MGYLMKMVSKFLKKGCINKTFNQGDLTLEDSNILRILK